MLHDTTPDVPKFENQATMKFVRESVINPLVDQAIRNKIAANLLKTAVNQNTSDLEALIPTVGEFEEKIEHAKTEADNAVREAIAAKSDATTALNKAISNSTSITNNTTIANDAQKTANEAKIATGTNASSIAVNTAAITARVEKDESQDAQIQAAQQAAGEAASQASDAKTIADKNKEGVADNLSMITDLKMQYATMEQAVGANTSGITEMNAKFTTVEATADRALVASGANTSAIAVIQPVVIQNQKDIAKLLNGSSSTGDKYTVDTRAHTFTTSAGGMHIGFGVQLEAGEFPVNAWVLDTTSSNGEKYLPAINVQYARSSETLTAEFASNPPTSGTLFFSVWKENKPSTLP